MTTEPGRVPMEEPLAYFLTWTTYGSWLPGDDRGWVERPGISKIGDAQRKILAQNRMTEPTVTLSAQERQLVEETIIAHCKIRGWQLHAMNVRMQHVHVVVTATGTEPKLIMDQLKAWCSRRLKEHQAKTRAGAEPTRQKWWTQRGSKRSLYDVKGLDNAIRYVQEDQGLPPCIKRG